MQGGQTVMFTRDITSQWLGWGQGSGGFPGNSSGFRLLSLIQQSDAL